MKIWKSLKQTDFSNSKEVPKSEESDSKISLEHAARSLPRVDKISPEKKNETVVASKQAEPEKEEIADDAEKKKHDEKMKVFNKQSSAALKELLHISGDAESKAIPKKITVEQLFKGSDFSLISCPF